MGASTERLEFDANASKVLAEYAKVIAESKKLTAELQKGAKEAVKGSTEASAGLAAQAKAVVDVANKERELKQTLSAVEQQRRSSAAAEVAAIKKVKAEEDLLLSAMGLHGKAAVKAGLDAERAFAAETVAAAKLRQERMAGITAIAAEAAAEKTARAQSTAAISAQATQLVVAKKQMGQFGASAGQANANITQLSFAADDFMTVLQMNNYSMHGWIAGLRSAGNNLSFVLASFNPMLALIPSVATALAGFLIPRLFGSADASKAAADSGKEYTRILIEQREALLGATEGEKAATAAREERVHQEQLAKITEETGFREKERAFRKSEEGINAMRQSRLQQGRGLNDPDFLRAMGQHEAVKQDFDISKNTIQKFVDDRRKLVAAREAKQVEEQQQANFKRVNAGAIRGAEGKYGTFSGDLKRRAEVGFAQGLSEEQVIANLAPVMAAGLNEGEQEAIAPKFLEDIAAAKQDAALKPGKSAEEVKASGLRQQLRQISAERAAAVAAAPRNRLSGPQERGFREQEAPVQAELAAVEAKMQADKGELTDGLKSMVDRLDTLIKVVSGRNSGRPVDRNGGQ